MADEETSISNWDGFADDVGVSIPLPFGHESFRNDEAAIVRDRAVKTALHNPRDLVK